MIEKQLVKAYFAQFKSIYSMLREPWMSFLRKFLLTLIPFIIAFLITSYKNVLESNDYYVPSGGPFFSKLVTPFKTWNLPAFTGPIINILEREDKFYVFVYLAIQAFAIVTCSHLLLLISIFLMTNKFSIAFFASLFFHSSAMVQQVFWSSPAFDFFPKIHLTEIWLLALAQVARAKQEKHFTSAFIFFAITFGCISTYIRNSSLPILICLLILAASYHRIKAFWFIPSILVLFLLVSLRLEQMGSFSFKYFFASSIPVSSQASLGKLASLPISPIPLNDGILMNVLNEGYSSKQLMIDKFFYSPIWFTLKMEILNLVQATVLFDLIQAMGAPFKLTIIFSTLFLSITIFFAYLTFSSFIRVNVSLLVLSNLLFVFLSRFSPQQEVNLSILASLALSISIIGFVGGCSRKGIRFRHFLRYRNSPLSSSQFPFLRGLNCLLIFLLVLLSFPSLYSHMGRSKDLKLLQVLTVQEEGEFLRVETPMSSVSSVENAALSITAQSSNPFFRDSFLPMKIGELIFFVPISDQNSQRSLIIPMELMPVSRDLFFEISLPANVNTTAELVMNSQFPSSFIPKDSFAESAKYSLPHLKKFKLRDRDSNIESCPSYLKNFCYVSQIRSVARHDGIQEKCWKSSSHPLILLTEIQNIPSGSRSTIVRFSDRNTAICTPKSSIMPIYRLNSRLFAWTTLLSNPHISIKTSNT